MQANAARGEAALSISGQSRVLRPTFAALVAAEEELGPLFALVERAGGGQLRLAELAALFWHCLDGRDGMTREQVGEAVMAQGLASCAAPLQYLPEQYAQRRSAGRKPLRHDRLAHLLARHAIAPVEEVPEQRRHFRQAQPTLARTLDQREQWAELFLGGDQGREARPQHARRARDDQGRFATQGVRPRPCCAIASGCLSAGHAGTTAPALSSCSV